MLIGKTANWLLRHSVQRGVKSRRWVCAQLRMREITRSVKDALKFCLHSFSTMLICRIALQNFSIQWHWRPFSATSVLRMRSNGYLWTSGKNLDAAVRFYYPDFLPECQNFGDLATFSVDFCILYAEWPPYFYFWFFWPTDLECIPHASIPRR